MKKLNLVSETYGLLTVIKEGSRYISPSGHKKRTWICKCKCGNTKEALGCSLRQEKCQSCGCINKEKNPNYKHGMKNTKEYKTWIRIKQRCYNPKANGYEKYGGKGIRVCDEWKDNFEAFYHYVGKAPSKDHSIDRINSKGDYAPGNVRWTNYSVQAINKGTPSNSKSGIKGVFYKEKQQKWCARIGINYKLIHLGTFKTKEEAVVARLAAEEQYYKPLLNN